MHQDPLPHGRLHGDAGQAIAGAATMPGAARFEQKREVARACGHEMEITEQHIPGLIRRRDDGEEGLGYLWRGWKGDICPLEGVAYEAKTGRASSRVVAFLRPPCPLKEKRLQMAEQGCGVGKGDG